MTYRLTPPDESFEPAEFAVFVTIPARKYRSRLGNYKTLVQAENAIHDNEKSRKDTLGGLLPTNLDIASYEVWKCESWGRVK
jgi:hypothetical protein